MFYPVLGIPSYNIFGLAYLVLTISEVKNINTASGGFGKTIGNCSAIKGINALCKTMFGEGRIQVLVFACKIANSTVDSLSQKSY